MQMQIERGSTWNRWDFHIHTPYSILNNRFGFDPHANYEGQEDPFDNYVKQLFTKAVDNRIAAIGITDYFSIEGYKRIRCDYLDVPEKMEELFPDEELREKIRSIYVFPNIEFRIENLIDEHPVNYHVIFSGLTSISDIEEGFLERIEISHKTGNVLTLTRNNIERIGREYRQHNPATGSDFYVGLNRTVVDYKKIYQVLNESAILTDQYMITIPVDEDLSNVDWSGRYYQVRKILYHQADMLMTSNEKTRNWALAKGHEEGQKSEFRSIKPCIWGSDAHDYDKMFNPDKNRFCWIKAEPSFEGLQQILYEPEERVRIQYECPEEKNEHQIIDYIVFNDDRFSDEPIYFSEGLTAIIGGKSTGKSILLRHIAKGTDYKQVEDKEKIYHGRKRLDAEAKVYWKDGVSDERKILYIPQSWLNRTVDDSASDTQLNRMIRDILLQQESIQTAHMTFTGKIAVSLTIVKDYIDRYVKQHEEEEVCENQLKETGRSDAFISTIGKLEKQRDALSVATGISEKELERYHELEKQIAELEDAFDAIKKEKPHIDLTEEPFVYLPGITDIDLEEKYSYDLENVPTVRKIFEEAIERINNVICDIWKPTAQKASQTLDNKKKDIISKLEELNTDIEPLKQSVAQNEQLKKIDNQIKAENEKLKKAIALETKKEEARNTSEELKRKIIASRTDLANAYEEYSQNLAAMNTESTDLQFEAEIVDKRKELFDAITDVFDNRNLRAYIKNGYRFSDKDDLKIDDGMFDVLWQGMLSEELSLKGGYTTKSALERLFSDWFAIHYIVKSGEDTISNMSPGKKALVLLELIVNLENSNCPILIDQPEDDLDNRSIYTDLVKYLKEKKHERQIIVVTHNANVVIGADAEEVIIANQDGNEAENNSKRFEYRCGAIENTSPFYNADGSVCKGVLNQKGIQEQICDILEGGKDAFEKRRNKYFKV